MEEERSAKFRLICACAVATSLMLGGCVQWDWDSLRDSRALEIEQSLALKKPDAVGNTLSGVPRVPSKP